MLQQQKLILGVVLRRVAVAYFIWRCRDAFMLEGWGKQEGGGCCLLDWVDANLLMCAVMVFEFFYYTVVPLF
eukprot:m.103887 g.103887  ORF g.103887 m.103887 type:complete len:72 (-) comp12625_c1_seq2:438-653(-)